MNALWQFCWSRLLAGLGGYGLCVVLCAAIVMAGLVMIAIAKQIAATKPTIEWSTKNGPIRVNFPNRSRRK